MPKDNSLGELLVAETLNRLDSKLDKLDDRLDGIDKTLIKQEAILDEHVKRTNLLESKMESDKVVAKEQLPKDIQDQLKLERHKLMMFVLKILGVVAGTGAGGVAIKEILGAAIKIWSP